MLVEPKKILILRLSSIGDILLTTAFVRQVRKTYLNAHITYIVKKEFKDLVRFNPHIDKVIPFDSDTKIKGLNLFNSAIKKSKYDFIFDLHNNLRTNRMLAGIAATKIYKIKKSKIKRAALVYLKINFYKRIKPIPERYFDVAEKCGVIDDELGLELFLDPEKNRTAKSKTDEFGLIPGRFICIGPGAAHYTKMWPVANYENLIEKFTTQTDYKVAILGSASERGLLVKMNENKNSVDLCGKLSLLESAAIISDSAGMVSNDSGLMHMAVALKKPVLAIFGSTVEELGFFPYRANATIFENKLWCRPCSHVGRKKCPLNHFKCMRLTTVDKVLSEVKRKLVS